MTDDILKTETVGRVRMLTLKRPEMRNALNRDLNDRLVDAAIEADHTPGVYAIAITGAGSAFSSGADLKDWQGR